MSFSNYLENSLLDHLFDKAAFSAPTIYVGLSTADPLDDGSGLAEPGGGNYARVVTSSGNWNSAVAGVIDNSASIIFATATASWGTISHVCLFDAVSGGNLLGSGALSAPIAIGVAEIPTFNANALDVSLD